MFCINDYPNTEIEKYDRISKFLSHFYGEKSEFEKCVFLNTPNELKEYIISKITHL